jgi:hypothetical protein
MLLLETTSLSGSNTTLKLSTADVLGTYDIPLATSNGLNQSSASTQKSKRSTDLAEYLISKKTHLN